MTQSFIIPFIEQLALYNVVKIDGREPEVITALGYEPKNRQGFVVTSDWRDVRKLLNGSKKLRQGIRLAWHSAAHEYCYYVTHLKPGANQLFMGKNSVEPIKSFEFTDKLTITYCAADGSLVDTDALWPRQTFKVVDGELVKSLSSERVEGYMTAQRRLTATLRFPSLTVPNGSTHKQAAKAQRKYAMLNKARGVNSRPLRQVTFAESLAL